MKSDQSLPIGLSVLTKADVLPEDAAHLLDSCLRAAMTVLIYGVPAVLRRKVALALLVGRENATRASILRLGDKAKLLQAGSYRVFDWDAETASLMIAHYSGDMYLYAPKPKAERHLRKTVFVSVANLADIGPRVISISEIQLSGQNARLDDIFRYNTDDDTLNYTGHKPAFFQRFEARGVPIPLLDTSQDSISFEDADDIEVPDAWEVPKEDKSPEDLERWLESLAERKGRSESGVLPPIQAPAPEPEAPIMPQAPTTDPVPEAKPVKKSRPLPPWLAGEDIDLDADDIPTWLVETLSEEDIAAEEESRQITPPPQNFQPAAPPPAAPPPAPINPLEEPPVPVDASFDLDPALLFSEEEEQDESQPDSLREALFTAFYPRISTARRQYSLYVYVHEDGYLRDIEQDISKFADALGGDVPRATSAEISQPLAAGTPITVRPEADRLEFDTLSITKAWRTPYTRFAFSYSAPHNLVGEIVNGRLGIYIGHIEIASINFFTLIADPQQPQNDAPTNPLAAAKFARSRSARNYDKIFISYSRKDTQIAETFRLAQLAVGHDVFMDTHSIHTGDDWRAALAKAIDEADIFQLFWSQHSAASQNVRDEWDYALNHRCADDRCVSFIRPVYWEQPMPPAPSELSHLNFRYVPFNNEE